MTQGMSRRELLKGMAVGGAAAALAACQPTAAPQQPPADTGEETGGEAQATPAAEEQVEITYLVRSDIGQGMKTADEEMVKVFEEKYPNITVNFVGVPWGDYNAKLLAMYAAGTPPEVSVGYAAGFVTFYNNGAIQPVNEYVDRDMLDLSIINDLAQEIITRDGKLWGMSLEIIPYMMFYRKDLYEEEGLDLPPVSWYDTDWTLDKVLSNAQALTKNIDDPTQAQYGLYMFAQQLGNVAWIWDADPFNDEGGPELSEAYQTGAITEAYYTQERMVESFQFLKDLTYEWQVMTKPSDRDVISQTVGWPFLSGRIAMEMNGQWNTTNFVANEITDWTYALGPYPYGPYGHNTPPAGDNAWFLGADVAEPEAGWTFLRYCGVEEGAAIHAEYSGFFPSNEEVQHIWFDAVQEHTLDMSRDDLEQVCLEALDVAFAMPGKTLDRFPELNQTFNQTTGPIWSDEATVEEGLQACQEAFERLIETF